MDPTEHMESTGFHLVLAVILMVIVGISFYVTTTQEFAETIGPFRHTDGKFYIHQYLYNTSVSGDIAGINTLTKLTYLNLYYTSVDTYTSTTLPDWEGTEIYIYDLGLDTTEVDNFLIDLDNATGAPSNGTLNIGGTNAARSSASDAALLSLDVTKHWAITVNETP